MTRLEAVITPLHQLYRQTCSPLGAAILVTNEYPPSQAREDVRQALVELATAQREICRSWNNVRARVATLEREQGNPSSAFYEGKIRQSGLPVEGCNCGFLFPASGEPAQGEPGNGHENQRAGHDGTEDREKLVVCEIAHKHIIPLPPEKSS